MNNNNSSNTNSSNTNSSNTNSSNTNSSNNNSSNNNSSNNNSSNNNSSNNNSSNNNSSNNNNSNNNSSDNNSSNNNSSNNNSSNNNNSDNNNSDNNSDNIKKINKSDNIIPYIIVFAILFIIGLILLTWLLDRWYKAQSCTTNPYIWCSDNWVCENKTKEDGTCSDDSSLKSGAGYISECYKNSKGLASCLFGITSTVATICSGSSGGSEYQPGKKCPCPMDDPVEGTNCLKGCPISGGGVANPQCCCCPGTTGCHITVKEFCALDPENLPVGGISKECYDNIKSKKKDANLYCRVECP